MREIRSILVVDDEALVLRSMIRLLSGIAPVLHSADGVAAASAILAKHTVDLVITDYQLGDGTAEDVLEVALKATPVPLMVVMSGLADQETVFELGHLGFGAFLTKPLSQEDVVAAIEKARRRSFPLALMATSAVGNMSVRNLANTIREFMHDQAMALANGNKTRAAMMLRIQRQSLGK